MTGSLVFIEGFMAGFVVCAPMGPIGLLAIRRTLINGRLAGLITILGASTADAVYCFMAGLGVGFIADFLRREQKIFTIIGALAIIALGIKLFFSNPPAAPVNGSSNGFRNAYLSGLLLMLANPMPILVFTAVFASLGIYGWKENCVSILIAFAGILSGSVLWAPILSATAGFLGRQTGVRQMLLLNRASGMILFVFGAAAGLSALIR